MISRQYTAGLLSSTYLAWADVSTAVRRSTTALWIRITCSYFQSTCVLHAFLQRSSLQRYVSLSSAFYVSLAITLFSKIMDYRKQIKLPLLSSVL